MHDEGPGRPRRPSTLSDRVERGFLRMGPVRELRGPGGRRVGAAVDGEPLWFETADAALDEGAEAIASCVLLPAVAAGRRLDVAGRVGARWLANVEKMLRIWNRWWGYPCLSPQAGLQAPAPGRAAGTALCFTGGVDSFYTLLCGPRKPDTLAFVHGYDIPLGDGARWRAFEPSFREVAAATGTRSVALRSNLRRHAVFAGLPWERAHGGPLAAIGHLLAGEVGTLLVSSSYQWFLPVRWGSRPETDPLWSSDRLAVVHVGSAHSRGAKVRAISGHDLARQHLRVCWENRAVSGNCSRCDKCVSTMVFLAAGVPADRLPTFEWSGSLADRLDRLPETRYIYSWREFLADRRDPRLAGAIRRLLRRSALRRLVGNRARPVLDRLRALGDHLMGQRQGVEEQRGQPAP